VTIDKRPDDDGRMTAGHFEGDLIIGTERSAIGTLFERATRLTMLVHLPRLEGFGELPRTKNGPALAGYNAKVTKDALVAKLGPLPPLMRRTLTWDRGKELSQHVQLKAETGIAVFFADAHSPWQRATNENTNGLLRQFFPKGTDLARWSASELDAVAKTLNNRPRKCLGWKTPTEAWDEHLSLTLEAGVATTG
jgi:IS30 family transposase